jgi:hypothetical protein
MLLIITKEFGLFIYLLWNFGTTLIYQLSRNTYVGNSVILSGESKYGSRFGIGKWGKRDGSKSLRKEGCRRREEVKVVPPRYIQERDHYVRNGAVARRLMCVACYNALKMVTRTRIRIRHDESNATKKSFLRRTVINNLLLR